MEEVLLLRQEAQLRHEAASGAQLLEITRLRQENARLRQDSSALQERRREAVQEAAQWQQASEQLRRDDAELRREDAELRSEDASLRRALSLETAVLQRNVGRMAVPEQRARNPSRRAVAATVVALSFALFTCCVLSCLGCCSWEDPGAESGRGEDFDLERFRAAVDERDPARSCLWCFCKPPVLMFTSGVVLVGLLSGWALWQMGLLQPILAQVAVFVYIAGVAAAFLCLLLCEVWSILARVASLTLGRMGKVRKIAGKTKNTFLDFFNDGHIDSQYDEADFRLPRTAARGDARRP